MDWTKIIYIAAKVKNMALELLNLKRPIAKNDPIKRQCNKIFPVSNNNNEIMMAY